MFGLTDADLARFWDKVTRGGEDECWPWQAKSRHWKGYGIFAVANGKSGGTKIVASRIACYVGNGPAPFDGAHALHSCDNPPCCNPAHLRWGSPKQNTADAIERKRHSPPPYNTAYRRRDTQPKGAALHNQSLTETQVREIWRLHLAGGTNVTRIAEAVGAKPHAVADVARGRSWRHLADAPSIDALKAGGTRRGSNGFNELAKRRALEARGVVRGGE